MKALDLLWHAALDLHNEAVNMKVDGPSASFEQRAKLALAKQIRTEVKKLGLDIVEPRIAAAEMKEAA